MTCKELADFLDDYIGQTMEPSRRAIFDEHLAQCPDCRAYLSSYCSAIQLGRRAMIDPSSAAAGEVPAEIIAAVLAARAPK